MDHSCRLLNPKLGNISRYLLRREENAGKKTLVNRMVSVNRALDESERMIESLSEKQIRMHGTAVKKCSQVSDEQKKPVKITPDVYGLKLVIRCHWRAKEANH